MYLSPSLNKRERSSKRQRNVSGLFISTFDKYRQLSLEYIGGRAGCEGRRRGEAEDERESKETSEIVLSREEFVGHSREREGAIRSD